MKDKGLEINKDKISGFFNQESEFNGELFFKGSFRIEGHFKGKINSESMLIVGEKGKIEADIKVGSLINNGEIKGNIQASEKVEINSKGRVIGTIVSPKLVIEEGAYLDANCQTSDKVKEPLLEKVELGNE
jgi:cytoskeletal protein CcmA (bactofilin family)